MSPWTPFYRIFNSEGRPFDYNGNPDFIHDQIAQWSPGDVEGYKRFISTTKAIFQTGLLWNWPTSPFSGIGRHAAGRSAPDLIRLQSQRDGLDDYASGFIQDDFLRRVFSFHPLLVGGNPFDTTSIYAMIHYLEREWGVHFAMGGTGAIIDALVKLFQELGGKIHLNSSVAEIIVGGRRTSGIRLADGREVKADHVISNADVAWTYLNLVPSAARGLRNSDFRYQKLTRYSMSLFVIYFGTKRRYLDSGLAHHNIILGDRYKGLLTDIFHNKKLSDDFSLYLHMPTLTDPSLAPEGHEGFYVLSPVPHMDCWASIL